jgi:hypothetical protein
MWQKQSRAYSAATRNLDPEHNEIEQSDELGQRRQVVKLAPKRQPAEQDRHEAGRQHAQP